MKQILKQAAKKLLKRRREYYRDFVFRRLSARALRKFLEELGLASGGVGLVPSAFSALGYFGPGPTGLIELLQEFVGPTGTIVMPTFSMAGSMAEYLRGQPRFDVRHTPSTSGALTEVFRKYPGVVRSLHP